MTTELCAQNNTEFETDDDALRIACCIDIRKPLPAYVYCSSERLGQIAQAAYVRSVNIRLLESSF